MIGPLNVELIVPFEIDLSPAREPLSKRITVGLIWLIASLFLVVPFLGAPWPALLLVLIFPIAALALLATTFYWTQRARRVHFSETRVSVRERRWGRDSAWSAPYEAFEGVLLRERSLRSRTKTQVFHVVELKHPDPAKCLPLHITRDGPLPIETWASAAKVLNLPSLIEIDGGTAPYPAEHMSHPIRELARQDLIKAEYDAEEPVPSDLKVSYGGKEGQEAIDIKIEASGIPLWLKAGLAALVLLLLAMGVLAFSIAVILLAIVLGGLLGVMLYIEDRRPRRIQLTRQTLSLRHPWAGLGPASSFTLPLDAITSIRGRDSPSGLGRELIIESSEGRLATGPGLDSAALRWLRRFLIASIANA